MFRKIADGIDRLNDAVGSMVIWLTLIMAIVMFGTVVLRYVFNMGWIWVQESVTYMHGILFMMAGGYALLHEQHVRIDIFYRPLNERKKAFVNIFGVLFLLFPTCFVIFYYSFPYVMDAWSVLEGSREAGGVPGVFLLKTVILIFPVLVGLQGVSILIRCFYTLRETQDPATS
ncbi:MAG: TRAP transporter small permease subunit [bacterium]